MAEFLNTKGIGGAIEKIITDANKELFLVSPYLQINSLYKDRIQNIKQGVTITLIYREYEAKKDRDYRSGEFVHSFGGDNFLRTKLYKCYNSSPLAKRLHAKCYMNEKEVLVTSMNLMDNSECNNFEMGILVKNDEPAYDSIKNEIQYIIKHSEEKFSNFKTARCIGCGEEMAAFEKTFNGQTKYLCKRCYNAGKTGGFCYQCGKEYKTTAEKPFCEECTTMGYVL